MVDLLPVVSLEVRACPCGEALQEAGVVQAERTRASRSGASRAAKVVPFTPGFTSEASAPMLETAIGVANASASRMTIGKPSKTCEGTTSSLARG